MKFQDPKRFQDLKHKGMVEMPSDLALKTARLLFANDHEIIKHKDFEKNRALYEPHPGFVYCDGGNGIMGQVFDERSAELRKIHSDVASLCVDPKQGDFIEVVLGMYREDLHRRLARH